eukprot:SAG11_NODE_26904_length_339_cov_1.025000_1_plen_64_part_00
MYLHDLPTIERQHVAINALDFAGDGSMIALGFGNGDLHIIDITSPTTVSRPTKNEEHEVLQSL